MNAVWIAPLVVAGAGAALLYLVCGGLLDEADRFRASLRSLGELRPLYVDARNSVARLAEDIDEQRRSRST